MSNISSKALSILLAVLGVLNILVGLNKALGGIATMGWQGETSFFDVTDPHQFLLQDSHMRFFGGVYTTLGLFMLLGSFNKAKYQTGLYLCFAMIFIGGIARFTMGRTDVVFASEMIVSLAVELILMPVFAFWLWKLSKS